MNMQTLIAQSAASIPPEIIIRNQLDLAGATFSHKVLNGHLAAAGKILEAQRIALGKEGYAAWIYGTGLLKSYGFGLLFAVLAYEQEVKETSDTQLLS